MSNEFILKEINLDYDNNDDFALAEAMHLNLGAKNKAGECYIKVKGNEGPIPHFHIESVSNSKFFCCIRIYEADYFHHIDGEVDLATIQKEILNKKLSIKEWNLLREFWDNLNVNEPSKLAQFENYLKSNNIDLKTVTKPDYTQIP